MKSSLRKFANRSSLLPLRNRGIGFEPLEPRELMAVVSHVGFEPTGILSSGTSYLNIQFSEPVVNAWQSSSYELKRAGDDGVLGTVDDTEIATQFNFPDASQSTILFQPLPGDLYRLTIRDLITDNAGVPLDGNQDGISGGNYVRDFVVDDTSRLDPLFGEAGIQRQELFATPNYSQIASSIVHQPDGKMLVAGGRDLFRLMPDGSLDPTFGRNGHTEVPGSARDIILLPDGKILVGGSIFVLSNNSEDFMVARFLDNGKLDPSFGVGGFNKISLNSSNDSATAIALQSDGKIVAAGIDGNFFGVARFHPDGAIDLSFDADGKKRILIDSFMTGRVYDVAVQADDKIVIVGETFNSTAQEYDFSIARLNADGTNDLNFGGDGSLLVTMGFKTTDSARRVLIQSDQKILIAGNTFDTNNNDMAVVRLNSTGFVDNSFGSQGRVRISRTVDLDVANALAVDSSNNIFVGGYSGNGSTYDLMLAKLSPSGVLDNSFDNDGIMIVPISGTDEYGMVMQRDANGQLVLGGYSNIRNSTASNTIVIARITPQGNLDSTWDGDGKVQLNFASSSESITTLGYQTDGKILASGTSNGKLVLARMNQQGSLDPSFDQDGWTPLQSWDSGNRSITKVMEDPNGRILVTGATNQRFAISRYLQNGQLDTSFDGDGSVFLRLGAIASASDIIQDIAFQPDGKIVAIGSTRNNTNWNMVVMRFLEDGSLDTSFDGDGTKVFAYNSNDNFARRVSLQPDDKILIGGFAKFGPNNDFTLTRLLPNGDFDPSFSDDGMQVLAVGPQGDAVVDMVLQTDGKILVGGQSFEAGLSRAAIVRFLDNGNVDPQFGVGGIVIPSNLGFSDTLSDLALENDGRILAYLSRDTFANDDHTLLRLNADGTPDAHWDLDGIQGFPSEMVAGTVTSSLRLPSGEWLFGGFTTQTPNYQSSFADFAIWKIDPSRMNERLPSNSGVGFVPDPSGANAGQLLSSRSNTAQGLNRLQVDGQVFSPAIEFFGSHFDDNRTLLTPTDFINNLSIHREITQLAGSLASTVRTVDTFTNQSNQPKNVAIKIQSNHGSDSQTQVFLTSDGDTDWETSDLWVGIDDVDGAGADAIIHFIAGPNGTAPNLVSRFEDTTTWEMNFNVPADGEVRIAYFTIAGITRADAIAAANLVIGQNGLSDDARELLSNEEVASIENFRFASAPTDILLSNSQILENSPIGSLVGTLSATDPNSNSGFQFSFVAGQGDSDNSLFELVGNELRTKSSLDFETRATYSIRLRVVDGDGLSFEESMNIEVLDLGEVHSISIGDGTIQRSLVRQVQVVFDGQVQVSDGAFEVARRLPTSNELVTLSTQLETNGSGQTVATLTFSGDRTRGVQNALVDGNYQLTIDSTKILKNGLNLDGDQNGVQGGNFVLGAREADAFFALFGDIDGNRNVSLSEFNAFRASFGKSQGQLDFNPYFDFDGNQNIGVSDFNEFRRRFGIRLNF